MTPVATSPRGVDTTFWTMAGAGITEPNAVQSVPLSDDHASIPPPAAPGGPEGTALLPKR